MIDKIGWEFSKDKKEGNEKLQKLKNETISVLDESDYKGIEALAQIYAENEMKLPKLIYEYIRWKLADFEEIKNQFDRKIQDYIKYNQISNSQIQFYNQNKEPLIKASLEFFKNKFQYLKVLTIFWLEPLGEIAVFFNKYPKIFFEAIDIIIENEFWEEKYLNAIKIAYQKN